jgi:dTDP-4-amino-4,6-dideoxygalactose transaminase
MTIAQKHNLYVIEDAAQAIGAKMLYQGQIRRAGSVGHFGCFSFFPSKNLGGFGDGGLLVTNESERHHKARIMRVHGGEPKYHHHVIGGNFRLDPLQATLLRPKLQRLDGWSQKRQDNAALYTRLLTQADIAQKLQPTTTLQEIKESRSIFLPVKAQPNHIYNQFTLLLPSTKTREHLREKLNLAHIGHEVYYPIPLHKQKCFFDLNIDDANFPIANALAEQTCVIPIFPELYEQEIQYVAQHIIGALKEVFAT